MQVSIVLPSSILSVESTLLLKSLRIHQVARWTSIFGVSEVVFYREYGTPHGEYMGHRQLIELHWRYFFTPPYLRRRLVPRSPLLRYVGALPPIRLLDFDVKGKPVKGEERVGFAARERGGVVVYLDNEEKYTPLNECRPGFTKVRVVDTDGRLVECLDVEYYMGPSLSFKESLMEALTSVEGDVFKVATDKAGAPPAQRELESLGRAGRIALFFGGPRRGLFEISEAEGFNLLDYVDVVWNTIPGQRVVSIRTEEAVLATLGLVNYWLRRVENI
ncbi:putative RNA uridine N3 methyltransferase [Desulfurococcus mucosus]|uniref:Uncharacterized protein n=1 Tax=Desulfurococcus mucosus (strain ATCC 35584 / DSM 2162 / JCM 9187 / O7/1) TaxID=765177 RepID=E8RAP3_DESM0|nr:putative RNA uridine N3 methyltransferase [Desulfurococcus mucosus]ADV65479.1 protein of unknown function DUF171 [Desulfurococcus mucosus DSM 2162]